VICNDDEVMLGGTPVVPEELPMPGAFDGVVGA